MLIFVPFKRTKPMKSIKTLTFFLPFFFTGFLCAQESVVYPFRVVSYNVENYFDCLDDSLTKDSEYLPGGMRGWNSSKFKTIAVR